jgi:hypothetical protein
MSKPRPDFIWPEDHQPDVYVSDDHVAIRLDMSKASVERIPDRPPVIYVNRLKRSSAHAWNDWIRRRLAAAIAAAAAASTPALPAPSAAEPPPRRKRGRPRKVVQAAKPPPTQAPPPGKRPCGRPRKHPLPPTAAAE